LTQEEVINLLEGDSPPSILVKKKSTNKTKEGVRHVKNTPTTMPTKALNLPKTTDKRPGGIIPIAAIEMNENYNYLDIQNQFTIMQDGIVSIADFEKIQNLDEFCSNMKTRKNIPPKFLIKEGILMARIQQSEKPVLPKALLPMIINTKHFTAQGNHSSKTRIIRDIRDKFYIPLPILRQEILKVIGTCVTCQLYNNKNEQHEMKQIKTATKPRESWSIDLIPSMPETPSGNKTILLAVDNFTGYIVCIPLKSKTSISLITAIRDNLLMSFGTPKFIRSDEETGIFNSKEFKDFMDSHSITLNYTSVGAPYSNGIAEKSIQSIKFAMRKILSQERNLTKWDETLFKIVEQHNSSISSYGKSPEQLMFATEIQRSSNLINIMDSNITPDKYFEQVFPKISQDREEVKRQTQKVAKRNRTYRNLHRSIKQFQLGNLVLHRQLQVSTGVASALQPLHTGPYVITKLNQDGSTALCQHLRNNEVIKAHFNNLQLLYHDPRKARMAQQDLDNLFDKFFATNDKLKQPLRRFKIRSEIADPDKQDEANSVETQQHSTPAQNTSEQVKQITQRTPVIVPSIFKTQPKGHHILHEKDKQTNNEEQEQQSKTRSGRVIKKPDRFH
jgi:hypothetical protein